MKEWLEATEAVEEEIPTEETPVMPEEETEEELPLDPPEIEQPEEEEPTDEEKPPEEEEILPVAPLAPTNLVASVNPQTFEVTLTWDDTNEQEVIYRLYVNDVFTGTSMTEKIHVSNEFLFNQAYRVTMVAFDMATQLTSEPSNEVTFTLTPPVGSEDPRQWIYSYLDNFSVKYQK